MPSWSQPLLTTQNEKPINYKYLNGFRVAQCLLFAQGQCGQHMPYTCFYWHCMNQRRRKPTLKADGSFNYSPDNYCEKYNESTGLCPDGDDCPFLHKTAGDTERQFHLRYFKTCMCPHGTVMRGFCTKNGWHCPFSHGNYDSRQPVIDIKEQQALESAQTDDNISLIRPNALDREMNLMREGPNWQDSAYLLANYKTELCNIQPRLCRKGNACPKYHDTRDKRRNPREFQYWSAPCPFVKHGTVWGDPASCPSGEICLYAHTQTERQYHHSLYKTAKCYNLQYMGYCRKGDFCAFAHEW